MNFDLLADKARKTLQANTDKQMVALERYWQVMAQVQAKRDKCDAQELEAYEALRVAGLERGLLTSLKIVRPKSLSVQSRTRRKNVDEVKSVEVLKDDGEQETFDQTQSGEVLDQLEENVEEVDNVGQQLSGDESQLLEQQEQEVSDQQNDVGQQDGVAGVDQNGGQYLQQNGERFSSFGAGVFSGWR